MFERFTDEARRVVVLGQEEARQRGHGEIGTEHMLLGLVDEGECDGAKALEMLRISPIEVRAQVDEIVGRADVPRDPTGPMPLTPCAKKVLELSSREAVRLGRNDIGTEHILLAIIREGNGVAAQVLVGLGIDLSRMRETVVELATTLGGQRERVPPTATPPVERDMGPEDDAPQALLDYDDPAALGAAATMSGTRVPRQRTRASVRAGSVPAAGAPGDDPAAGADSEVVSVFEAGRSTRPQLRPYLESLWERRPFMMALAKASIRGRRSSTMLGSIWGLIDPMFQAAIYLFLYFVIRGGQGRAVSFLPVLVGGMFLFRFTATAIGDGGRSILNAKELMLSTTFPRAVLPLAAVYKGALNFIPSIFVFLIVYAFFGAPLHGSLVFLPLLFAIQTVMNVGIALIMSTVTVFVRDIENALSMITRVLLFTTPVIYPVTLLPPALRTLLSFNPLFPLFASYQVIIAGGGIDYTLAFQSICWAIALVALGGWLFLRYEHAMAAAAA
jgi:ABC-type polysaccharide/polyol phosphate export permease